MDLFRMPISMGEKRIFFIRCSFCSHLQLPDGYHCADGHVPCDECPQFDQVTDVDARVRKIFSMLPDGAGRDAG